MERVSKRRGITLIMLVCLLAGFFAWKLYDKQVIETGGVVDNTTVFITKTRIKAARGDILDRNGNVLVGNRASYDLVLNHYILQNSNNPNQHLYNLVKLCQELGIEYVDHLPVTRERPFTYTLDQQNSTWRGYYQQFLSNRGRLDSDISAPLLIEKLRESYYIPEEWSDEDARLVLGLRYELTLRNFVNLSNFVLISDAADKDLSAILELNIPGLKVESSTVREYHTKYAAHILGYVGAMSPAQWEERKDLGIYSMDAEIGQSGFEEAFEEYLRGTDGWRYDTVTADGTVIESRYDPEPKAGNHVEVTIDINLQTIAEEELAINMDKLRNSETSSDGHDAEGASVVVIDVKTGQVLVCASYPTYDLATFRQNFAEISEDPLKPMYNRALQAAYPPGSTYKMSMIVTAANLGRINIETEIQDKGVYTEYEGFTPKCLRYTNSGTTHGFITPAEALCVSCNYFFYYLGDKVVGLDDMDKTAAALGLGELTGVELDENRGWRANEESKAHFHVGEDKGWYAADKLMAAIGQSENRFTPIQLCTYAATLANKGTRMRATFLNRVVSTDYRSLVMENQPEIANVLEMTNDAYLAYSEGMKMVVSDPQGTAYWQFFRFPVEVAAKTGTAQTGIRNTSDNGAFVCYAPASAPEIAIAVYGEKAGHGSSMAYVAKSILSEYFAVGEISEVITNENMVG